MTLIVALKYGHGSILATDTRVMYGPIKRDQARKLEPLTKNIGIAAAGLLGAIDDILRPLKEFCESPPTSFDDAHSYLSDLNLEWFKRNAEKLGEGESAPMFIMVSPDRVRRIFEKGYSEESYDYICDGSGRTYGEYILRNFYKENMEGGEAKELAIYTILETSKMDPSVGDDIQMVVFPEGEECKIISKEEIEDIKACLTPISRDVIESRMETIENIIKMREEMNSLWEKSFGFKFLLQNEKAVFQITKPCRSESEFTSNIAALALLIDQLNISEMKKSVTTEKEGSINILEDYLTEKIKEYPSEIISNLRDIITMRSKKFPIHTTDPKFVDVVIKITGKYPPNWPELYSKALDMYKESLNKLLDCLQKSDK